MERGESPRKNARSITQEEKTTVLMEGIEAGALNWDVAEPQNPQNGKEKEDKGKQSLPGTWPLGVRLPASHPPDCPCWKMQELLREEELGTLKGL